MAGGDKLDYDDDTGAPIVSLIETKLLINSLISEAKHGANFFSCELKVFSRNTYADRGIYEDTLQIYTCRHQREV